MQSQPVRSGVSRRVCVKKAGLPAVAADQNGEQWQRIWRLWAKYFAMGPPRVYEGVQASIILPWPEPPSS